MTQPLRAPFAVGPTYAAPAVVAPVMDPPNERPARGAMPVLVASLVVLIAGLAVVDTLPVGVFFDDGMYVILAKSLATGHGLRWLQLPGMPAAAHYPPGYPAVLALLWAAFPRFPANVVLFKIANACFLAAAAGCVAAFLRRRFAFSSWAAVALAVIGTASLPTLVLSAQVMSEPLFLALLVPTLLFAERVIDRDVESGDVRAAALLGLVVGLVTLVRANGIALAAAAGLLLLTRRRWREALAFGLATIFVLLPWQLWVRANAGATFGVLGGSYEPYSDWLVKGYRHAGVALAWRTVKATSREIGTMFAIMAAPSVSHSLQVAALMIVLVLAAIGARPLWRRAPATAVFLVGYLLIVLFWPFTPTRFVWAIWPLVLLSPVLGVIEAVRWRPAASPAHAVRIATIIAACLVAIGYARYNVHAYRARTWSAISRRNANAMRPLVQWVRAHTPRSAVVASDAEPVLYLYAGRSVVPVSQFTVNDYFKPATSGESSAALRGILAAYHVDVIAVMPPDSLRAALQSMASGRSPELVLRDSMTDVVIYSPVSR
ncbi:MAG TPA: hypothetical protein VN651_15955 [Gemmatimonadaceae bacterium]|nr:hypothetical protein [Gemmatimonadaceae bacterium]